jgi:selenocysteine lyase/cysteine desulfurase
MSLFYASPSGLDRIQTLGHYFHPTTTLEYKLGLATSSYELVSSLPSIVAYFGPSPSATWAAIEAHESELQTLLLAFLNAHPRITVLGETSVDTGKRVCTVAFVVEGWEARGLVDAAYEATGGRMGIRWGAFYSERLVGELLGLALPDGVVRVSMVHYNTGMCFFLYVM